MRGITTKYINPEKFPLVVEATVPLSDQKSFMDLVRENNKELKELLLKEGVILFRNWPITKVEDFAAMIEATDHGSAIDYIGGDSPRNKVLGNIYTSTEAPPSLKIPLHNELSFVKNYPSHIYFYCETAPIDRGETIIGDARRIYQSIDQKVREKFVEKGLRYVSRYYYKSNYANKAHKTWINVFETEDKREVEKKCIANEFEYKWMKNDWLEISQVRPAVMDHPHTKEKIWFNQVHLYDFNPKFLGWRYYLATKHVYRKNTKLHDVYYADGSEIARHDLYHIMDMLDKNTVKFPWKKGDIMMLDNILAMHGRAAFSGKRRVLTAMTREGVKAPKEAVLV
jgi:alpha-ketoglutarate-dependent taurine dioxygenase